MIGQLLINYCISKMVVGVLETTKQVPVHRVARQSRLATVVVIHPGSTPALFMRIKSAF